jgi:SNF2 family DNA or RNA helicase
MVIGYKNLDILKARIDPYILSMKRDDCIDLPPRTHSTIYYEITDEQREAYNAIIADGEYYTDKEQYVRADLTMIKINKLVQILSGFLIVTEERTNEYCANCDKILECVEDSIHPWDKECTEFTDVPKPKREYYEFKKNPKLETLSQALDLLDEKVIIWTMYQKETEQIIELLKKKKITFITPKITGSDKIFDEDPSITVYLGQISQGIGITINSAAIMWYYNRSLKLEDYLQSMDRNYRIGQKKNVFVNDFICQGTIEGNIVALLSDKKDVKEFLQEQVECQPCEKHSWCFERGIIPYSTKCKLYEKRVEVEKKTTIKVKEL